MRKLVFLIAAVVVFASLFFLRVPSSQAQSEAEKKFMRDHQAEMTTFMEKCSGCHSLQRIFAKKRSREEWTKILNNMGKMPHAMITQEELQRIQKWIDFMQSTMPPGP